jgi:hypothetical protein
LSLHVRVVATAGDWHASFTKFKKLTNPVSSITLLQHHPDSQAFYDQCDPIRENLCLYG